MTQPPEEQATISLLLECDATAGARWFVQDASLDEQLNEPYTLTMHLSSAAVLAEPIQMLGQSVHLTIIRGSSARMVTGVVTALEEGQAERENDQVTIIVKPAFDTLRYRINTKIFQEKTVPEILEEVIGEGFAPYERTLDNRLTRTYLTNDFRVQYDESDFDFCERLMEEEGIAYWFEHEGETEVMVLADSSESYGKVESIHDSTLQYTNYDGNVGGHEYVDELLLTSRVLSTKLSARDYDWSRPSFLHEGESTDEPEDEVPNGAFLGPEREVYHHDDLPLTYEPGGTTYANDKDDQIRIRREALKRDSRVGKGSSTVFGMKVAAFFSLAGHSCSELDGEYLVTGVTHQFSSVGSNYSNVYRCLPKGVVYRPIRTHIKPRVPSILTATVVGPAGEEIHTDEHGRIKVQFHWDRLGTRDEHSSCWVRVMQPWAGAGWGFVFIPRIGMEVIVNFIAGDLDQPLVIGSVYNGEHPPPYPLPEEKTKSTIKTESSLGGGGYNELRFEDKAGSEEIFTHAQKDYNEVVENDHNTLVHHDQTNTVDNNQTEIVHVDQSMTVDRHRDKTIGGNETTNVGGNRTETVKGNESVTVMSNRATKIVMNDNLTVTGMKAEEVLLTNKSMTGIDYSVDAGNSITLTTGQSSLTMKKDGTIELKGVKIEINGKSLIKLRYTKIEEN